MLKVLLTIGFLQLLTMLAMLVRTKALALLLGPEQVGIMAVIDKLLAVICQTISLSLPFAAVRFLPELWGRDREGFAVLFRRMRNLLLLLALLAAGAGVVVTAGFPGVLGEQLLPYRRVVLVAFLGVPVLTLAPFLTNAIAGRLEQNRSMVFALGHAVVLTVTGVVGVLWSGLLGAYLLYALAGFALVAVVSRHVVGVPPGSEAESHARPPAAEPWLPLGLPARIWRFSLILFGLTFIAPYGSWYVHYGVLRHFGAETAGWMQAAMGVSLAVRALLGSAHAVFLTPQVNRGGTREERMLWTNEFHKTLCLLVGVLVPPLLLFPHLAIRLLYSKAFLPGASYVALFVITETLTLLAGTYQALVVAFDRLGYHVVNNVLAQLLLLGVAAALIPSNGVAAAGIANLSAPLFMFAATTIFLWWRYGLKLPLVNGLLSAFLIAGLATTGFVGASHPEYGWGTLAAKLGLYAVMLGALTLFLTPADRTRLGHLYRDLRGLLRAAQ